MGVAASGDAPFKRRAKNRGRGGGPVVRTPRGAERVWGLAPIGGRRPDRAPADRGPPRRTHGPQLAAGEGGRREARATRGPTREKKRSGSSPDKQ
jgi:hypothetical protein